VKATNDKISGPMLREHMKAEAIYWGKVILQYAMND
jgi:hypothetical protein